VTYNPSTPLTLGPEWTPATEGVTPLTTPTTIAAWWCDSAVTETISTIYVPHTWTGPSSGYGKLVVDVYDLADSGAGTALTTTRYQPNETKANSNLFAPNPTWGSVTTTAHTYIDETTYTDSDYLALTATSYARLAFNTTAFSGQVASVSFDIRVFGYIGTTGQLAVDLYNGSTYVSRLGTISPPANGDDTPKGFVTYRLGPFTTNPLTGVAWTATDIANMDTGTNLMVQIGIKSGNAGNVGVSWLSMIVESGADKRVATGSTATQTSLPSGTQTNLPVTLASNWSKVSGTNYLLVARRLDDPTGVAPTLIPQPIYLASASCPHVNGQSYTSTVESSGLLASAGSVDTSKTYGFWLGTSGGAISADSQPYFDLKVRPCHATSTLKQGFLGTANTYKGLKAVIGYTATPEANLSVKIKRTSDNVQLGGTATVTTAILDASTYLGSIVDGDYGQGTIDLYLVDIDLASTAGLAAVAYYFEFTSTTLSSWWIALLDATASHSLTGNQTFGGSTYQADVAGSGVAAGDFLVRASTAPVVPSSITVTLTTATINGVSIDYADVDWVNGGALGAAFSRWEVERSEDSGTTWVQVATIATEATVTFADYEGKRGTACKYRVRSIRTDEARSDWVTQSGTITPVASSSAKAIFTTNSNSALTVGYTPHGVEMVFEDLTAAETVFVKLHARDYQASFRPLEQRGIRWPFTAQVHTSPSAPSAGAGVRAYGALRAIATDPDAPYLCLHTADGERFFGALQVGSFRRMLDGTGAYLAECVFTETQGDSSAVAL